MSSTSETACCRHFRKLGGAVVGQGIHVGGARTGGNTQNGRGRILSVQGACKDHTVIDVVQVMEDCGPTHAFIVTLASIASRHS